MASSVATPLEQQFAAIPGLASMNSTSGLGATSITLQFDLDRNIDGAATDVQTAINAASGLLPKDLPNPPTYRKVNPADRAVLIYAVSSDDLPLYKVDDYAFVDPGAEALGGDRRVAGAGRRPAGLRRARAGQSGGARRARHRARGRAHGARRRDRQPGQGQPRERPSVGHARHQRPAVQRRRPTRTSSSPTATARRSSCRTSATSIDATKSPRTGAWYNGKRAELLLIYRQPGANTVEIVDRVKAHDAAPARLDPAERACRPDVRPLAVDPRFGRRRAVHADADHRPGRAGDLHLPAPSLGDDHPQHRRAAGARRHVRRDVCAAATASTTCR